MLNKEEINNMVKGIFQIDPEYNHDHNESHGSYKCPFCLETISEGEMGGGTVMTQIKHSENCAYLAAKKLAKEDIETLF